MGEDGKWYDKEIWVPEEEEGSIGSIGIDFGKKKSDDNIDSQDEESIGSIGIFWKKKETDEVIQTGDEEPENRHEPENDEEESEEHPDEQSVPKRPLAISKIVLPPILFWISWMVLPIIVGIMGYNYLLDNSITVVVTFMINAAAFGTLMYIGAVLTKKEVLIMYGVCLAAALLCCMVSVSLESDFGTIAFVDVLVGIIAAAFSFILHFVCKEKRIRVVIAGVGAVMIYAAQLSILWFG